jgi:hypothetical protein
MTKASFTLVSRSEAKAQGLTHYFTGKPCVRGHIDQRFTSIGKCKTCAREDAYNQHKPTTNRKRAYKDLETFVAAATEKHGGKYSYEHVDYKNAHAHVAITCPKHGDFLQSPTNHIQGKGCPTCSNEKNPTMQPKDPKVFFEQAKAVWGEAFDYSESVYVGAKVHFTFRCTLHDTVIKQTPDNHLNNKQNPCPRCNHMKSAPEQAIAEGLALFTPVVQRDRTQIAPKELDVLLPEKALAIEYCGEYWHSSGDLDHEALHSMDHYNKYKACQDKGIRLITVFETEWKQRNYALRRLLRNAVGASRGRVMARKCTLRPVEHREAADFYDRYHPQGGAGRGAHYGLYWNDKLVACMRFTEGANDRGANRRRVWTLTRYATRINVAGGASRLFKAFLQDKRPREVKSFSDNRYFEGGMYEKLGFTCVEETKPDYQVWHPKLGLLNKPAWQRRSIPLRAREIGVEVDFDPDTDPRTERDLTFLLGGRRIYDCGKKKWVWKAA